MIIRGANQASEAPNRPLVAKERALLLFHEYAPEDGVMNVGFALEAASEPIDVAVLRSAMTAVVARHPALRTLFPVVDGEPVRTTLPSEDADVDAVVHVQDVAAEDLPAALRCAATARFEVTTQLPIQVTVFRAAEREVVCVTVDHLVYDAHSAGVVRRDLVRAYAGLRTGGALPADLLDEVLGPPLKDGSPESINYWTRVLANATPSGDLDLGRRAPRAPGFPGAAVRLPVHEDAWAAARSAAHAHSCPVSAVALAAFATVLFRHGAGTDIVFGVPTYNRGRPAHDAVGYYMCVVPVRIRFGPETTFAELTRLAARRMLEGLQYADASIDEVQAGVYEGSGVDQRPLVRYLFNYLADLADGRHEPSAGYWHDYPLDVAHSRMDIDLALWRDEDGVVMRAIHAADLMTGEHVAVLLARMERVLRAGAAAPDVAVGTLEMVTDEDGDLLAASEAGSARDCRDVLEDVATSAFADVSALAVAAGPDGQPELGYGALVATADAVGAAVRAAGVPPGALVAVAAGSLADTCAAVLGCWSAGYGALLGEPRDGVEVAWQMIPAGTPAAVGKTVVERVDGDGFVVFDRPHPDDVALCCDGPDGAIVLTHRAVADAVSDIAAELSLDSSDVVTIARKGGAGEVLLDALAVLRSGGQVAETEVTDEAAVAAAVSTSTVLVSSPLVVARVLDSSAGSVSVTRVAVRGGRVPAALVAQAAASGVTLVRVVGPLAPDGVTVAGRLDPASASAHLTGAGRTRVVGPSGEMALPFTRGVLDVHGARGPEVFPVQLTDRGVEQVDDDALAPALDAVLAHPLVRYAAARRDAEPAVVLVEPRSGELDVVALAGHIRRRYGVAVELCAQPFPLRVDGEPDLAANAPGTAEASASVAAPEIDGVDVIALWQEILGRDDIGPDANFFALGGDSLKAARVVGQLKKRTGRKISLRTAFKFPTPASFAAALHTDG